MQAETYQKDYYQANRAKKLVQQQAYALEHQEQVQSYQQSYKASPRGVLTLAYHHQVEKSRRRGHAPPAYSRQDLLNRYLNDPQFLNLHAAWLAGGKRKADKPSLDRLDDALGYSFENIKLTTWALNNQRGYQSRQISVVVFRFGNYVGRFDSLKAARLALGFFPQYGRYALLDSGRMTREGYQIFSEINVFLEGAIQMAANNQCVLIGRAGNDVSEDAKTLQSGDMVAAVRLAVNRPTKDAQGNSQTDWVSCEAWGKNAERLSEFVKKGDLISVSGALRIETWEKDGQKHSKTLIRIENFQMLESRAAREQRNGAEGGSASAGNGQAQGNSYGGQRQQRAAAPAGRAPAAKDDFSDDFKLDDDELPPF